LCPYRRDGREQRIKEGKQEKVKRKESSFLKKMPQTLTVTRRRKKEPLTLGRSKKKGPLEISATRLQVTVKKGPLAYVRRSNDLPQNSVISRYYTKWGRELKKSRGEKGILLYVQEV